MCHSWNCLLLQLWHLIYICCWQDNGVRSKKSKGKTTARRTSKKKQKTWRVCTKICVHHTFLYHFIYVVTTVVLSFMSLNVDICVLVCLYLTICLLPFTFLPCSPKTMTKKKKTTYFSIWTFMPGSCRVDWIIDGFGSKELLPWTCLAENIMCSSLTNQGMVMLLAGIHRVMKCSATTWFSMLAMYILPSSSQ